MKKLIALLLVFISFQDFGQKLDYTPTQLKIETTVAEFLSRYHYLNFKIDDSLSSKIFDNYLDRLDPNKIYFTSDEVKSFEKYRYSIDEALVKGDLNFPFEVFNVYMKNFNARQESIEEYLQPGTFDFTNDETLMVDRSEAPWPSSENELKDLWRKNIKSQALSLKLANSNDSTISSTLSRRNQMVKKRMQNLKSENVFDIFMNAFTQEIDPHTSYMIPETADEFNIDMSQSLEGIGARLQNDDEYVKIMEVIPGGPLYKSKKGNKNDYIIAVAQGDNGEFQDIVGWLTNDAVKLIRGKKGSVVRLKLLSSEAPVGTQPRIVKLVREKVNLADAVATSEIIDVQSGDKNLKIGRIDIPMFYRDFEGAKQGGSFQSTSKDVKKFLEDFNTKGVDGVLIDLRNNGGGSLFEAIELSGLFIKDGPVVQRRTGKGNISVEEDVDSNVYYDGPLLILQNRFSASASEIFAGAIQDYGRGLIVGEQSYGKGTVQQLVNLDRFFSSKSSKGDERFGELKLTTEKFYRITGNSTQLKGVMPDITFPSPFDLKDSGESSYPSALPFDQIKSSEYQKVNLINAELVKKLDNKFKNRAKDDEKLQEFIVQIEDYKKLMDKKEYSLNYEVRKKEKEETIAKNQVIKKLSKTNINPVSEEVELTEQEEVAEDETDIYLIEAELILADLISMG